MYQNFVGIDVEGVGKYIIDLCRAQVSFLGVDPCKCTETVCMINNKSTQAIWNVLSPNNITTSVNRLKNVSQVMFRHNNHTFEIEASQILPKIFIMMTDNLTADTRMLIINQEYTYSMYNDVFCGDKLNIWNFYNIRMEDILALGEKQAKMIIYAQFWLMKNNKLYEIIRECMCKIITSVVFEKEPFAHILEHDNYLELLECYLKENY